MNDRSRLRRAAELNVQGRSYIITHSLDSSASREDVHPICALLFGGSQSTADGSQIHLDQRKDVAVGRAQGGGADLFDFCHQSSSLITSNTRDTEREAGWAAGIFSASPPSRGQPETHTVVHRADDNEVQHNHVSKTC